MNSILNMIKYEINRQSFQFSFNYNTLSFMKWIADLIRVYVIRINQIILKLLWHNWFLLNWIKWLSDYMTKGQKNFELDKKSFRWTVIIILHIIPYISSDDEKLIADLSLVYNRQKICLPSMIEYLRMYMI